MTTETKAPVRRTRRKGPEALPLLHALRKLLMDEDLAIERPTIHGAGKRGRDQGFVDALCAASCQRLLSDANALKVIREEVTDWVGQARAHGTPREPIEAWAFAHGVTEEAVGRNVAQWHAAIERTRTQLRAAPRREHRGI